VKGRTLAQERAVASPETVEKSVSGVIYNGSGKAAKASTHKPLAKEMMIQLRFAIQLAFNSLAFAVLAKTFAPFPRRWILLIIGPALHRCSPASRRGSGHALAPGIHIGMAFLRAYHSCFSVLVV
jgi:hypothetical protein